MLRGAVIVPSLEVLDVALLVLVAAVTLGHGPRPVPHHPHPHHPTTDRLTPLSPIRYPAFMDRTPRSLRPAGRPREGPAEAVKDRERSCKIGQVRDGSCPPMLPNAPQCKPMTADEPA